MDDSEVYQIRNSFLSADKLIDVIEEKRIMAVKSEEAIYTSRLLQFQNVLDRRNISNYSTNGSTTNYEIQKSGLSEDPLYCENFIEIPDECQNPEWYENP
ncbi:8833_t:CDS:2 [Rhizophagus irregularis]|nr:8833_t:CDS:2 [Rhizophagus irregularis]